MSVRRGVAVVVGASVLLAVVMWVNDHASAPPSAGGGAVREVTAVVPGETVHVASDMPRTTFVPLGLEPNDGRTLSAQRAYNAMLSSPARATPIPAGIRAYYGVLTGAQGARTHDAVRVWAFAVDAGCLYAFGALPPDEPVPPPVRCRTWEFVDALSGDDLGVVTQQVLPG